MEKAYIAAPAAACHAQEPSSVPGDTAARCARLQGHHLPGGASGAGLIVTGISDTPALRIWPSIASPALFIPAPLHSWLEGFKKMMTPT